MNRTSIIQGFLWMAAGAVILLVVMLVVLHFQTGQSPAEQLAFKAKRADLVARMRLTLASASEAEKSAVLAVTDQDSQTFADQARAATAEVERERKELGELLAAGGTQGEKDLLDQFSKVFIELQRIDNDLLSLAVKNTNIKAYSLAFGPAADALKEMDTALSRLVAKSAGSPEAGNVALLAFGAQTAALRIQTLLAPHIAEESDKKMDELEALMTKEDRAGPQGSGWPGRASRNFAVIPILKRRRRITPGSARSGGVSSRSLARTRTFDPWPYPWARSARCCFCAKTSYPPCSRLFWRSPSRA